MRVVEETRECFHFTFLLNDSISLAQFRCSKSLALGPLSSFFVIFSGHQSEQAETSPSLSQIHSSLTTPTITIVFLIVILVVSFRQPALASRLSS